MDKIMVILFEKESLSGEISKISVLVTEGERKLKFFDKQVSEYYNSKKLVNDFVSFVIAQKPRHIILSLENFEVPNDENSISYFSRICLENERLAKFSQEHNYCIKLIEIRFEELCNVLRVIEGYEKYITENHVLV